ncbi:hypothetical protein ACFY9C_32750 [Streptomyces filamentosus]|uniref:hypothetical protein n=1 Tax=Streptomyces filamentosus TaxID=67294 RepID=UPI0036ED4FD0
MREAVAADSTRAIATESGGAHAAVDCAFGAKKRLHPSVMGLPTGDLVVQVERTVP